MEGVRSVFDNTKHTEVERDTHLQHTFLGRKYNHVVLSQPFSLLFYDARDSRSKNLEFRQRESKGRVTEERIEWMRTPDYFTEKRGRERERKNWEETVFQRKEGIWVEAIKATCFDRKNILQEKKSCRTMIVKWEWKERTQEKISFSGNQHWIEVKRTEVGEQFHAI